MYRNHFGLKDNPFGITPDPRFLFLGGTHEQALASLLYGIEQRQGFVMVTGEVGTGKTLLCRALLERLGDKSCTALILNPFLGPLDLIEAIVADFGISPTTGSKASLIESLNRFLLEKLQQGKHVVLILDEAQTLPTESLEQIRLLSNLETDREKLLQIVLVGQPELLAKLNRTRLRQVNQRITVRCNLQPLPPREIRKYVAHRLRVASDRDRPDIFTPGGLRAISLLSRGYPREINALCDRALLAAYAAGSAHVDVWLVYRAFRDLRNRSARSQWRISTILRWAVPSLLLLTAGWLTLRSSQPDRQLPPAEFSQVSLAGPFQVTRVPDAEAPSDGASLSASLTTLAMLWKRDLLAEEVRQWQFVSLKDKSLPSFFLKSGLARTHGMEIIALPATVDSLRTTDLPCLASEKSSTGYRFVVLSGLRQTSAVILDPAAGPRVTPLAEWLAGVRGSFFFLVPQGEQAPSSQPGNRKPAVPDLRERLRFLRLSGTTVPSLRESP